MNRIFSILTSLLVILLLGSCSDGKSYAELLSDENKATNNFLANQRVIGYEKRDSTFQFETGEDAPYYQMDKDANLFMQVIKPGTRGNWAVYDQSIYFRFTRYNLLYYVDNTLPEGSGNDDEVASNSANFRFNNSSSTTYSTWGEGVQIPLFYLPIDCEVNLVIKSQLGSSTEIGYVIPYLMNVRYFKSQI